MGDTFSKKHKEVEKTYEEKLKEKYLSQTNIRALLFAPGHAFKDELLEDIVSIPLTDYHMGMTYEEVTLVIIENRQHIGPSKARMVAKRITHGKSLKHLKRCTIVYSLYPRTLHGDSTVHLSVPLGNIFWTSSNPLLVCLWRTETPPLDLCESPRTVHKIVSPPRKQ